MYQHIWYNKKKHKNIHPSSTGIPACKSDLIDKIEYVRISDWQEHCLECSAPACYSSCSNYDSRFDGKCSNLKYGINRIKAGKRILYELTFRRWGKLETIIYPATVSVKFDKAVSFINFLISKAVRFVSAPLRYITRSYFLCERYTGFTIHLWSKWYKPQNRLTDTFILQCYSFEKEDVTLFLDIIAQGNSYRNSFLLSPGNNEIVLPLKNVVPDRNNLARLYPENDAEPHIAIEFMGFVKTKPSEQSLQPAKTAKCVVWDLDNTLWDGILLESEPDELKLRPKVLETIKELDQRGILNSIASKNNQEEADQVLKRLGIRDYFLCPMINWDNKADNLTEIAKHINIDVNTFIFIDDSPFERASVSERLPQVRVYDENIVEKLLYLPELNVPVTEESRMRRTMYSKELERTEFSRAFEGGNIDFLKNCNIELEIFSPKTSDQLLRCYELVLRTNQLNLSAKKYSNEEFDSIINNKDNNIITAVCKDRFGSYGQILFLVYRLCGNDIEVIEFAMSCRVAAKYVENALLRWIREHHNNDNLSVKFLGNTTSRNHLLVSNLINCGMSNYSSSENEIRLLLKPDTHVPNSDIIKIIDMIK